MSNVYMTSGKLYVTGGLNGCCWIEYDPGMHRVNIEGDYGELKFGTKDVCGIEDADDFYEFVATLNEAVKQMKEMYKNHIDTGHWNRDVVYEKDEKRKVAESKKKAI